MSDENITLDEILELQQKLKALGATTSDYLSSEMFCRFFPKPENWTYTCRVTTGYIVRAKYKGFEFSTVLSQAEYTSYIQTAELPFAAKVFSLPQGEYAVMIIDNEVDVYVKNEPDGYVVDLRKHNEEDVVASCYAFHTDLVVMNDVP